MSVAQMLAATLMAEIRVVISETFSASKWRQSVVILHRCARWKGGPELQRFYSFSMFTA
jgi:hypothetical protein